jgi:Ca2+-binding RTX toxin-like protein
MRWNEKMAQQIRIRPAAVSFGLRALESCTRDPVTTQTAPASPREFLFVDPDVRDSHLLLAALTRQVTVVHLTRDHDPLAQIATALAGELDLTGLHILSHGAPGALGFAAGLVDADTLSRSAHLLTAIRSSLSDEASVVLYGCSVAADGGVFATALAGSLGVPVRASEVEIGAGTPYLGVNFGNFGRFSENCMQGCSGDLIGRDLIPRTAMAAYPHTLPTFDFTGATDNDTNITQTVSGVVLTLSDSRTVTNAWNVIAGGGAGGTTGDAAIMVGAQASYTFQFDTAVDVTSVVFAESAAGNNYTGTFTFAPNTGSSVTGVALGQTGGLDGTTAVLNFSGITSFDVTLSNGNAALVFDTVIFAVATVTAAASNAAGFNTTNGTNLTPSLTFVANAETLTIGTAGHVVGSTISGAGGADTISAVTGTDFTQATALADFETLVIADGGAVTMTEAQHDSFSTLITGGASETITISGAAADSQLTGAALIETYVLNTAGFTFTLGADGQSVSGSTGTDTVVVGARTATGTLNGQGGADTLTIADTGSIAGATVSNFETVDIAANAGATMTVAQHNAFTTFTNRASQTITLSDGGTINSSSANIENYQLSNTATTFNIGTGATAQNVTGGSVGDTINVGSLTVTGTLNGAGGSDTLSIGNAGDISGATVSNFETVNVLANSNAHMTVAQHTAFTTFTNNASQTITFSDAGTVNSSNAGIENYVLANGVNDFKLGATATAQNVTGNSDADTVQVGGLTVTGTLLGGGGADVLTLGDGANISGATVASFETVTIAANAGVTMSIAQHGAFTTFTDNASQKITLSDVGSLNGNANIESYVLASGASTFTVDDAGQSVTGVAGNDTIIVGTNSTLTGTLDGGADTDTLSLGIGADISGATVSNFENLTLGGTGSYTLAASHLAQFTGTITAANTETIIVSGNGNFTTLANIENYTVNDDTNTSTRTITLTESTNVTANSGSDAITFNAGALTLTGTLTGEGTVNDTLQLSSGANITGATLSAIENLTLSGGASVTMTSAQHAAFSGTVAGTGADTIMISDAGTTVNGAAAIENYVLSNNSTTFNIGTGAAAQNVTGGSGNDTIGVGAETVTGTLAAGTGTDVLSAGNGADISGATLSGFESFNMSAGAVIMTGAQHNTFGASITGAGGADTITLDSTVSGANVTGSDVIENYVLTQGGFTFTVASGLAGQNVVGSSAVDTVVVSGTPTGTLNAGGDTDTLSLLNNANTSGATISNFENLTLAANGTFTMAASQLAQFAGTISATGTETLNVSGDGAFTTLANIETFSVNDDSNNARTVTVSSATTNVTDASTDDVVTFSLGNLTYTGTLTGQTGAADIVRVGNGNITGATFTDITTLDVESSATATMTEAQHDSFTTAITGSGTNKIIISNTTDGLIADADIEQYQLNTANSITLTAAGQFVTGSTGNDTINVAALTATGTINGGTGTDTLTIAAGGNISGATISNFENLTLTGTGNVTMTAIQRAAFTGALTAPSTANLVVTGSAGDQAIVGGAGADTLDGGAGADTISGGAGADNLIGGTEADLLVGGAGADTISGGAGADLLSGGADGDSIGGGSGTDTITLGAGTDTVFGSTSDLNGDTVADFATGEAILLTGVAGLSTANVRFNGSTIEIDTNATTFAAAEVTISTSTDLSSTLNVQSVADSGGNTLITFGTANAAPAFTGLNGGGTFTEGGTALQIDSNVTVADTELDALNGAAGNYSGASLTVARNGGANAEDVFGFQTTGGVSLVGSNLQSGGNTIATFSQTNGTLTVTFTSANGTTASSAIADSVLQGITYSNSASVPTANVTLDYTFNDGTSNSTGTNQATITNTDVTAAASNAAAFNTTTGANLTPAITFGAGNETLTIGTAAHAVGSTIDGGAGTDTVSAVTGTDFSGVTFQNFEVLTIATGGAVTMTEVQHDALTTINGAGTGAGGETITIASNGGNDIITGADAVETYVLSNTATTFNIGSGAAGQNVTGGSAGDTINVGALTVTGTLNGGAGTDTLTLSNNASIAGATVSNFENLTLTGGAKVTMTEGQYEGFTGTVTAAGADTLAISANTGGNSTISGNAAIESYELSGTATDFTVVAAGHNVTAGVGNDTINLGALTATGTLNGGGGTDTLTIAAGGNISGATVSNFENLTLTGTGNVTMTAAQRAAFTGTLTAPATANLVVTGSAGNQALIGAGGADTIDGGGGSDTLSGAAGADNLSGGADADTLFGGADGDQLTGGSGADVLSGGAGADLLTGGNDADADTMVGGAGADTFRGSAGTLAGDTISDFAVGDSIVVTGTDLTALNTTIASSTLATGAGNLTLTGISATSGRFSAVFASGNTTITLVAPVTDFTLTTNTDAPTFTTGVNTITADAANVLNAADTLDGLAGADILNISAAQTVTLGATTLVNVETINITAGAQSIVTNDATVANGQTLTVNGSTSTSTISWNGSAETNGTFSITGGTANDTVTAGAGADTILGGAGADTLIGNAGTDVLNGGAGNDLLRGGSDNDTLSGGDGIDTLSGGTGSDLLVGGAGTDTLSGDSGADTLRGGADADVLKGFNDNDLLSGGAGADELSGGAGADTLVGGAGADTFTGSAAALGGDTISDFAVGDSIVVTGADLSALNGAAAAGTIATGGGNLTLTGITSSSGTFNAVVAGGNTTITLVAPPPASGGGGGGGDTTTGQIVVVPTTPTTTVGGSATNTANTITNTGTTAGSTAIVQNTGNNGNVVTATLPGSTTITSEGPSTAQTGTEAQTTLVSAVQSRGSASNDPLVSGAQGFLNGLGSTTTLDVRTIVPTTTGTSLGSPIIITGTSSTGGSTQSEAFVIDMRSLPSGSTLQLDNIEFASIMGSSTVNGGAGENYVTADENSQFISLGDGNDTLYGGDGDDTVGSGSGIDFLYGEDGNDRVFGGTDNDQVFGGTGTDAVYGNQGADAVYGNQAADTLYGGQDADTLFGGQDADIAYGNLGDDIVYGNYGADILYGGQGNDVLYGGQSGDIENNSGNSFDLLYGGVGDDTLYGGQGVDWVFTGSGADKIVIGDAGATDVIGDFDGAAGDRLLIKTNINGQAITSGADLVARASDNADGNAVIDLGSGYEVRLIGVKSSELTADYFEFY